MSMKKIVFCLSVLIGLMSCKNQSEVSIISKSTISEKHRPAFHFTPDSMWMNDPNGMVYHEGEYHLFYQYYPDSTVWGPMHWGHAVSKDMVSWEHLPIALYPDSLGYIFSGSAVIDKGNTSGLGLEGKEPMIAIFTHHNIEGERAKEATFQYQSMAYSNDNGRTFTKYKGNPVLKNPGIVDFRDPKVIWHEDTKSWVMVLAVYDRVHFYSSPNLIIWTKTGEFGIKDDKRLWECPDLFPMKVEGSNEVKWVLITSIQKEAPNGGTATSYFVGDFDGKTFKGDPQKQHWLDYGTDNYAFVTWSNVTDGRTLGMGWMSNWQYAQQVPTEKWRSAMTIARSLTLHKSGSNYIVRSMPVIEIKKLEGESTELKEGLLKDNLLVSNGKSTLKLDLIFQKPKEGKVIIRFSNSQSEHLDLGYDAGSKSYFIDRSKSGNYSFSDLFGAIHHGRANYEHQELHLLIYIDKSSVELFADDGQCVITDIFFPSEEFTTVEILNNSENTVSLLSGKVTDLKEANKK